MENVFFPIAETPQNIFTRLFCEVIKFRTHTENQEEKSHGVECPKTPSGLPVVGTRDLCAPHHEGGKRNGKHKQKKQTTHKQRHQHRQPRHKYKYVTCRAKPGYANEKSTTITAPTRVAKKRCNRKSMPTPHTARIGSECRGTTREQGSHTKTQQHTTTPTTRHTTSHTKKDKKHPEAKHQKVCPYSHIYAAASKTRYVTQLIKYRLQETSHAATPHLSRQPSPRKSRMV